MGSKKLFASAYDPIHINTFSDRSCCALKKTLWNMTQHTKSYCETSAANEWNVHVDASSRARDLKFVTALCYTSGHIIIIIVIEALSGSEEVDGFFFYECVM